MFNIKKNSTLNDLQKFSLFVYKFPNDKYFSTDDMLINIQRFLMRGLKGIRKKDNNKTKFNLIISLSWIMSLLNRLYIRIDDVIWERFPYLCRYCGTCPCSCKEKKIKKRVKIIINNSKRPKTVKLFQKMFEEIYPSDKRTLEQAGIHLAEESGELAEAILAYKGTHNNKQFEVVKLEIADLISCLFAVFNSLKLDLAEELSVLFSGNCHECKKAPCECDFDSMISYKS